ncbi:MULTISPECIES: Gfo/Idh/MocA family protein [Bacillota]|uniref:Oxidoreductase domain protein n=2 Tax=Bacillota TaxID=1239 RepID=A0A7U3YFN1_GEOS0|nr:MULTISPECIES: Gfo/Idh/MocA family oxidoreductase [Bacillota]EID44245.1 oxidoreductase, NAD-binding [Parageobacillus thermoglucosidasius TNO-09.020]KYD17189.1 Myo-inositol 2-dehydrogenase 1 [Anoxybacillus flavithermus]MBY6275707.1 gfo/Idh/MocA family oxidoreductase [Symbiobacterium thermophilum]OAO84243.1 Myo-inositol 2-dehydrogenase 1 [Parageobacillus thermoglucosidasius]
MGKKQVRIGMVGYKFMGKAHSHAFRDIPFFFDTDAVPVLQAVAGRDEQQVKQAAEKLGWASYETDWRCLIERDDIDVIDIVTPNHTHAEIAIAAAKAGKHVICEKPLALTLEQSLEMLEAVNKAGVVHMVCHNYRFAPAVQFAKQLIDQGKLGKIYHIRATFLQDWLMDPDFPLIWRLKKEISGSGTLGDIGTHIIDLARFLVGEFSEVIGMMETFIKKRPLGDMDIHLKGRGESRKWGEVDVDDAVAFLARFENGALGVFEATRFSRGNRAGNRFEINGERGSIRWDMENMNNLQVYLEDDERGLQGFRTINCTEVEHPYASAYWPAGHIIGYEHTFINLLFEMMNGIAGGYSPAPNFEDGVRNQAVLEAVERSSQTGKWIKISELLESAQLKANKCGDCL